MVLTGGEPTLRRDLAAVVAYAHRGNIPSIVVETNATTLTQKSIRALAAAGLGRVRIHMPGWGTVADRITGESGGHTRACEAIRRFAEAGITVDITVPIVRSNTLAVMAPREPAQVDDAPSSEKDVDTIKLARAAGHLLDLLGRISDEQLPVARIIVAVVRQAPDGDEVLPLPLACAIVEKLAAACRGRGQILALANEPPLVPCAFDHPGRVAHLFALTPGGRERPGHVHAPACATCRVFDRCPGPSTLLASQGFEVRPISGDRIRRRLSIIASVEQQIERELVTPELYTRHDGVLVRGTTIRINFHCNQACHFCFVSTHLPPATDERVRREIVAAAKDGGHVILSGGEPTLNPQLEQYIALARNSGAGGIEIQTNATLLGDEARVARLVAAGLQRAFVSLHGATAETSDAVTAAPGTHLKTLAGIDVLTKLGVTTQLNFVFCRRNHSEFPAYVEMVASRWPQASICVSFVGASTDMVPLSTKLIPRYRDIVPDLGEGLLIAKAHGIEVAGFDSMCGLPLCLVPGDLISDYNLAAIPEGFDGGEFVRADACTKCARSRECFGIRRRYADLYGVDELHPLS